MITLQLVGFPEDKPTTVSVIAETAREALHALKLQQGFNPREETRRFECRVEGCQTVGDLDVKLRSNTLTITCRKVHNRLKLHGGGDNPIVRIVIGVALIIAGVVAFAKSPELGVFLINAGLALTVGGIAQLLQPDPPQEDDESSSRIIGNFPNTVKSGTPIPIVLGEHRWGGHLFSLNIESREGSDQTLLDFATALWDDDPAYRRDSWLSIYNSPYRGTTTGSDWDVGGRRRVGDPINPAQ